MTPTEHLMSSIIIEIATELDDVVCFPARIDDKLIELKAIIASHDTLKKSHDTTD